MHRSYVGMCLNGKHGSATGELVELRVRYAGVPIGTTAVAVLGGLAHGVLAPGSSYELVRARVDVAGQLLAPNGLLARRYWPPTLSDFADVVAGGIAGGYELEDLRGVPVAAASVSVFASSSRDAHPLVVIDFRPAAAHMLAVLPELDESGGGRRRPAA